MVRTLRNSETILNELGHLAAHVVFNVGSAADKRAVVETSLEAVGGASGSTSYRFTARCGNIVYLDNELYLHSHEEPKDEVEEYIGNRLNGIVSLVNGFNRWIKSSIEGRTAYFFLE